MNDSSTLRSRLGASVMLAATTAALAACGAQTPVQQVRPDTLGFPGGAGPADPNPLGTGEAVALFVLGPLVILLVIAALVWLPGMVRGARYRPAQGWSAAPLWFGGPPDPAAAVESAQSDDLVRGGASGNW